MSLQSVTLDPAQTQITAYTPSGSFGQATRTRDARQAQFGIKISVLATAGHDRCGAAGDCPLSRGLGYSLAMRLRLLTVLGAALTSLLAAQDVPRSSPSFPDSQSFLEAQLRPLRPLPPAASRRVRDLLSQMTLKEKVGQMTQLEIGMITDGQEGNLRVNPDKLRKAVNDYGVGSILNVKDIALPPAKWHEILGAIARAADQTRLKIPVIYGLDSVHGANYVAGATIFPQALGMASTWDFELMLRGLGAGGG